jgi:hypothetical protein
MSAPERPSDRVGPAWDLFYAYAEVAHLEQIRDWLTRFIERHARNPIIRAMVWRPKGWRWD